MASFGFHITGDFITQQARTFWADDQEPDKAVKLLEAAFPEMTPATRLAIITGSKKLVGDEHGVELVDDDATESPGGNPLDHVRMHRQLREEIEDYADAVELKTGNTELWGTPTGGAHIPKRRVKDLKSGKLTLDQVAQRPYEPVYLQRRDTATPAPVQAEPEPLIPVEPCDTITQDNGWLDPEGRFYPCQYGEHVHTLMTLSMKEEQVDQQGWIKIATSMTPECSDLPGRNISIFSRRFSRSTQAQMDRVFDRFNWLPEWMKETE